MNRRRERIAVQPAEVGPNEDRIDVSIGMEVGEREREPALVLGVRWAKGDGRNADMSAAIANLGMREAFSELLLKRLKRLANFCRDRRGSPYE